MTKRKITAITFFLAVIFFISACGSEKPALDPDLVDGSIAEPVAENENPFESLGYITLTVVVSSIKGINDFLDDCAKTFTKKYPNIGFEFVKEKDYFTTYNYSFFSETLSNNVLYTVASQGLLDEIGDMDKAVKNSIKEIESELGNDFIGKDIYESLYNSIYVSLYESIRLSALDSIKDLL
ncbi:MAG: hypothetical protein FWE82_02360, partial [Defluviitaleaceae bacterium]|nr:hypothetical protein [Defluviitaleaceae bacterium]